MLKAIASNTIIARLPRIAGRWLFALSSLTGLAAGLSAALVEWCLNAGIGALAGNVARPASTDILRFHPLILLLPALGGLASALLVVRFCPKFHQQGADAMIHAFHRQRGKLELRGPLVKAAASVVVISCG